MPEATKCRCGKEMVTTLYVGKEVETCPHCDVPCEVRSCHECRTTLDKA